MSLARILRFAAPLLLSIPTAQARDDAPEVAAVPDTIDVRRPIDWRPALGASAQIFDWLADTAHQNTTDPDEREAIDRVHRYVAARLAGHRACCIPVEYKPTEVDLLTTAGALIDAFGLARSAGPVFGAVYAAIDRATRPAPMAVTAALGNLSLAQLGAIVAGALTGAPLVAHGVDDGADDSVARGTRARGF